MAGSTLALVSSLIAVSALTAADPLLRGRRGVQMVAGASWWVCAALVLLASRGNSGGLDARWAGVGVDVSVIVATLGRPALVMDQLLDSEEVHRTRSERIRGFCGVAAGLTSVVVAAALSVT